MSGTSSGFSVSIGRLIAVPAVITLLITIVRLVGELQHWPPPWVSPAAGGGGAIIGISWLPIVFGPYFAWKLAIAGNGPSSTGKAIGMSALGLLVLILGAVASGIGVSKHITPLILLGAAVMLASAFLPRLAWRPFGHTLLAYAFTARIPVLIVMFVAMNANGGQGWGTHYDVVGPELAGTSFAQKFLYAAILPQMTFWIGWTTLIGSLLGSLVLAILRRGKNAAPTPA